MKKIITTLLSMWVALYATTFLFAVAPKLTPAMEAALKEDIKVIEGWVADSEMINAVKAQNSQNLSLDEIKKRDEAWKKIRKAKGKANDLMKQNYNHAIGKMIRQKNKEAKGRYPEAFLTDNQGANVAVSKYTSDYWQGDEGKWKNSIKDNGTVFIGEPEFDESTRSMLVQVSVPVKEGGTAIGVLVVGVKFSKLK